MARDSRPELHDPDGHDIRFYTIQQHTSPSPGAVTTISDARESEARREREHHAARTPPGRRP